MTPLLIKLFAKKGDVGDKKVRASYASLASITGIIVNLLLFAVKLAVGLISASVAIVADAFNNISDAGSALVTLFGFRLSEKHADKKHPMGHGRIEYISAFIVDILIILVGFELFKTSVEKIISPVKPEVSPTALILLGIAVLVKLWLFFFYGKMGRTINSQALKGASLDSISDTVATTLVFISAIVTQFTGVIIDGWAGVAVALFILFTGIKASKDTIELLLGASPDPNLVKEIYAFVKNYPEVVDIHDVMVHDYGPGRQIFSFHAEVPSDSDLCYAHDVIDAIERDMQEHFGCIVTIHLDPIVVNDENVNKMRAFAAECAKEIDPAFTIHDFRMTDGGRHINVIFDLTIPTDIKMEDETAAELVADLISKKMPKCHAVIKPEHPFV